MKTSKLPAITEEEWQGQVVQLAKLLGYKVYHTWISIHSQKGFPDLVLCKPPRLIFIEAKTESGKVTPDQQVWLDALQCTCAEVYVFRPSDLERIRDILR
jgi:hypothetical protein